MVTKPTDQSKKTHKKHNFNLKNYYAFVLIALLGFIVLVAYYANQQMQIYQSSAATPTCNSINKLNLSQVKKKERCTKNNKCEWIKTENKGRCIAKAAKSTTCTPKKTAKCKTQGRKTCKDGVCIGCNATKCKSIGGLCKNGNCKKAKAEPKTNTSPSPRASITINASEVAAGRADAQPGDTIYDHGLMATVPQPGLAVYVNLDAVNPSGIFGGQSFVVSTSSDGRVSVSSLGDESATISSIQKSTQSVLSSSQDECEDSFRKVLSYKWNTTLNWYLNTKSIPKYLNAAQTLSDIRDGHRNWTWQRNNCGRPDRLDMTTDYKGATSKRANIEVENGKSKCKERDEQNTIDFGALTADHVAVTCTWVDEGIVVESDMRLNRQNYKFTTNGECRKRRINIEGTITHERGHTFGLGDVYDSPGGHPKLTMGSGLPDDCGYSSGGSTLGLGDMLGLEGKY